MRGQEEGGSASSVPLSLSLPLVHLLLSPFLFLSLSPSYRDHRIHVIYIGHAIKERKTVRTRWMQPFTR
jgi:hypothetical protein